MEAAVDEMARVVPADKIILGMAGYGYDWTKNGKCRNRYLPGSVKHCQGKRRRCVLIMIPIICILITTMITIRVHHVFFTDAATNFNTLRFATEYGLAGTAIWRLGSEDNRLWDFYDKDMSKRGTGKFNFEEFNKVESSNDVDYIGEGEILDVVIKTH